MKDTEVPGISWTHGVPRLAQGLGEGKSSDQEQMKLTEEMSASSRLPLGRKEGSGKGGSRHCRVLGFGLLVADPSWKQCPFCLGAWDTK